MPKAPQQHRISVRRTARFWTLEPTEAPRGTLYVLHGYGQLAGYFIRKFQSAADAGWRVIAPEGGHRFYLSGTAGRVGASWMTKEDRTVDIADYVAFLDDVAAQSRGNEADGPRVLLGFSQGVATAMRWLALGAQGVGSWDGIIAHSGVLPPDLPDAGALLTDAPPLYLIAGKEDPYIDVLESGFVTSEQEWQRLGGPNDSIQRLVFNGGHVIHPEMVLTALHSVDNALGFT